MGDLITTNEAATRLGVTRGRDWQLIKDGRLPVGRMGARTILIRGEDLGLVADRKPGRPGWLKKEG